MAPPRPRMYWMDALRGLAVLLVVLQHSTSYPAQRGTNLEFYVVDVSADVLSPYRMPLLLLLSGMLLGPSVRKSLFAYFDGKIRKILWPLVLWALITGWSQGVLHDVVNLSFWLAGPLHMWYLGVLLFCYAVGPVTRWISPWVVAGGFLAFLFLFDPDDFFWRRLLYYAIYFFLGAAIWPHITRLQRLGPWFPITMGIIGILVSIGSLARIVDVRPQMNLIWIFAPLAGMAAIVWLGPKLPRMRWLEFAGRRSIVLYVAHFPIMVWITLNLAHLTAVSPWVFYTVQMGLGLGIPIILALNYRYVKLLFEFPLLRLPGPSDDAARGPAPAGRQAPGHLTGSSSPTGRG